ncbi:MAG TPA: DUF2339 domain-containing protein [Bacillota bacterium]|nr:DUF2339 domain-containing protein [Bacillota bacterium]
MTEKNDHYSLEERLTRLEHLIEEQNRRLARLEQNVTAGSPPRAAQSVQPPPVKRAEIPINQPPITSKEGKPPLPVRPVISGENLEARIGGTWLNRIGVLAFVLGIGFFLKYAFENNWIDETGRVVMGLLTGIALLGGGEAAQKKGYARFAQGITGGGIAILYLAIFASFQFYHLIGQIPAFGLMALVTVTAVLLAVRYDSMTIAIMGTIGGFLTPFLLNTGRSNTLGLFSYIGILDLGILATAYFKNWRPLNYLSFALTQAVIMAWLFTTFNQDVWVNQTIFTVFFIIFAFLSFFHNILHKKQTQAADLALIFLNASIFFCLSYSNLEDKYQPFLGLFAAKMAAIYFALGYLTLRANQKDKRLILTFLGVALIFLTMAVPIQLKGSWITVGWAMEGLVLTWIGFKTGTAKTRYGAWVVYALTAVRLIGFDTDHLWYSSYMYGQYPIPAAYIPLWNMKTVVFLFAIISMFTATYLYYRNHSKTESLERYAVPTLAIAANLLILWLLSTETVYYFDSLTLMATPKDGYPMLGSGANEEAKQLTLSAIWAVYSILLIAVGFLKKSSPVRMFAIILFGVTILKVFLFDLSNLDTIYRILSFLILGAILILVSFLYQVFKDRIPGLREEPGSEEKR